MKPWALSPKSMEADYDSPVEFTAKPKKTTYFKKGRTLTVRRIDGEGS